MIGSVINRAGGWLEQWITRRQTPRRGATALDRRRVYILPTGYGYVFAIILIVLFLWAVNYNNSMGFALTFLLAATAMNAMWRSNVNLVGLTLHPVRVEPVFAGHEARFGYRVENPDRQPRYAVVLTLPGSSSQSGNLSGRGSELYTLTLAAERRGYLRPGRLRIDTRFPLGLFEAWSWVTFDQRCLVYPAPVGQQSLPSGQQSEAGSGGETGSGSEDYAGLRSYAPGDSPRHVAWKAAARDDNLLVKRFTGQASPDLWLDWAAVAAADTEARLSQLCRWVLQADRQGRDYGLRLPGVTIEPASGERHYRRCLEALALYGKRDEH